MTVGEEADMSDAVEPVRNRVLQEPPHELVGGQFHHLGLAVTAVVLPGETDLTISELGQSAIGNSDAMGVAAEIGEHLLGAGKRPLGVDDPLRAAQCAEALGKCVRFGECGKRAGEAQLAGRERRLQLRQEQCAEPAREDPPGQEEPRPAGDPSRLVRRQPAARDDAVQARMVVQGLSPGMQHGYRADLGAEMARIGGDVAQRLGRRAEQNGVDHALVLERDLRCRPPAG